MVSAEWTYDPLAAVKAECKYAGNEVASVATDTI